MRSARVDGFRWVLLGAGLLALGLAVALYNLWPDIAFRSGLMKPWPPLASQPTALSAEPGGARGTSLHPTPTAPRIVIPGINVDVRIYEGDAQRALRLGVYRDSASASPGEPANMVIAGHRDRRQFALLRYLEPGDGISVFWRGMRYDYRVSRVFQVEPTNTTILARGNVEMITLYTCIPRFLGNKRTVVIGERIAPPRGQSGEARTDAASLQLPRRPFVVSSIGFVTTLVWDRSRHLRRPRTRAYRRGVPSERKGGEPWHCRKTPSPGSSRST